MAHLAVLAEGLAVVRGGHDERPAAAGVPGLEERGEGGVGRRDLAPVGIVAGKGGRRIVGRVRVEEVRPDEDRPGLARQPHARGLRDRRRAPLREIEVHARGLLHRIVVEVEAAMEAEAAGEGEAAHESRGRVAAGPQRLGQCRHGRPERVAAVAPHAVLGRQPSGQDRRVGREGDGSGAEGVLEAEPVASEGVEGRRAGPSVAVAAQAVGAQRVDRHEQHRGRGRRRGGMPRARGGHQQRREHRRT
jgi:hypothetical protein